MNREWVDRGGITAVLGPTNTGKTHYAIERMLSRESGIMGLPLRLLAREIYDRIVALRGPRVVSLVTGEERIAPPTARYHICTVEAMPRHAVDFVAIDEVQLAADPDRGHVFTDHLLNTRGHLETLFLGSETIRPMVAALVPEARFEWRERFSTLTYTGSRKISRLKPRTAVVAFSVDQVYAIAELVRRQRGGAAVVMGALSPRTRNAQVALYQEGEVDYMIATDAIGMGLNLDVDHVAFAGLSKFDGWKHRHLAPNELAQIAGRAGRYRKDGTFGVTGEAGALDEDTVAAIEAHRFRPLSRLMWRSTDLDFGSAERLIASLEVSPASRELQRAREAEDLAVLKVLSQDPDIARDLAPGRPLRLLWDVCQIPDFRKTSPHEHATMLGRIYRFLREGRGVIPSDWLAGQVQRLDRTDGDIDALSKRQAYIRTWTYVANRSGWVEDPTHWQGVAREVEDRLSDALHGALTQRFVDRRTSHLMRRLKQKERLVAEIDDKGGVHAEGHYLGRLDGFRFTVDENASDDEIKTLRSASLSALQAEFAKRADKFYLSPDTEIDVTDQGGLMWGTDAVGRLAKGDDPLAPKVIPFVDDMAEPAVAEKVQRRLTHWIGRKVNALFEPMLAMRDDEAITGLARGIAFRLVEHFGIIPRRQIADDIKQLAQEERALLRKHGVRFGQYNIFMPAMLKPAPTRLRLLLWSLWHEFDDFAEAPPPGLVTISVPAEVPGGWFEMAGYRACGTRALRIDMLERLADLIRNADAKAGFEATQDMLSITGLTLDQFAELMSAIGYRAERGERERALRAATAERAEETPAAESAAVESEAQATTDAPAADAAVETGDEAPALTEEGAAAEAEAAEGAPTETPEAPEAIVPEAAEPSGDAGPETAARATEVFYTFTLAPRRQGRRDDDENRAPRRHAKGGEPGEKGPRRRGKGKGPKGDKGGKQDRPPGQTQARPPRKEKPVDPNSPFAILQQLKNR